MTKWIKVAPRDGGFGTRNKVTLTSGLFLLGFQFWFLFSLTYQKSIKDDGSRQNTFTELQRQLILVNGRKHNRLSGSVSIAHQPLYVHKKNDQPPLVFGIGPGTTGTHTHFNAACRAGLPSVHHASFCVSPHVGARGVSTEVMKGLHAHINILELNELAYNCARSLKTNSSYSHWRETAGCKGNVLAWVSQTKGNITTLLSSGIVGLFDYPYPNMADYILDTLPKVRGKNFEPTLVMTKRDPWQWAKSRLKHGFLLCRENYDDLKEDELEEEKGVSRLFGRSSPKHLSEFDIFECINRAVQNHTRFQSQHQVQLPHLTLSDVFHFVGTPREDYKKNKDTIHKEKPKVFLALKSSMEWHQQKYFRLAKYTPDFFGENKKGDDLKSASQSFQEWLWGSNGSNDSKESKRLSIKEVAGQLVSVLKAQGFSRTGDRNSALALDVETDELDPNDNLSCVGQFRFSKKINHCFPMIYLAHKASCLSLDGSGKALEEKWDENEDLYVPIAKRECDDW